ncbi:hypothetical protein FRC02_010336 [Tulasnella sp. 418]|nr:hypothetical protein FRC02_010336 [Tulasnella sp. 418]
MEFFRSRSFRRRKRDPKSRPLDQVVNPPAPIPPSKAENSEIEKKATNVAKQLIQPRRSFPGRGFFGKSSRVLKFPKTERPPVPSIVQAGSIAPSSKPEAPKVSKVTIGPGPKQALQRGRSKSAPGQLEKTSGSKIPTLKQTGGRRYTLSHQVPTPRGVKVSRPCLPRSALKFGQIPKKTTNRSPPPTRLKEQSIPTPPRSSTRKDEPLPILQLTPVEIGASSNYWSPQSPPSTCESRHVLRFGEDDQCNSVDSQHDLRVFYRNQDVEVVPLASTTIADLALNAARFSPVANSNPSKLDRI